ncbi:MAG: hypothetical protein QW597_06950 [Thermoplasmataceae archaeon]
MKIVSYIGKSHDKVIGYSRSDLAKTIAAMKPTDIIFTYLSKEDFENRKYGCEVSVLLSEDDMKSKIRLAGIDHEFSSTTEKVKLTAEDVVRKNIVDMIYSTIYAYLEGYWKDYDTVNSEVTDALFRARRLFVSQSGGNQEDAKWEEYHEKILSNVNRMSLGDNPVLVVPVESAFWFKDNLKT